MKKVLITLVVAAAGFVSSAGCDQNGKLNAPNVAAHGTRCLIDVDCLPTFSCERGDGDVLGYCIVKGSAGATHSAPVANTGPANKTPPATGAVKPKNTTPEPLPPPKPPKGGAPAGTGDGSDFAP